MNKTMAWLIVVFMICVKVILIACILTSVALARADEWTRNTFENSLVTTELCMKIDFDNETGKAIVYSYAEMREK